MTTNEELSKLDIYKSKRCIYCNRKYPKTLLNIEGVLHHAGPFRCVNVKDCNKERKVIIKRRKS